MTVDNPDRSRTPHGAFEDGSTPDSQRPPRGTSVSFVFPIYNEAGNIGLLYETLTSVLARVTYDVEILFVNDGSTDRSLRLLRELESIDDRVVILDFARNYGHQIAVTAGLDHAKGDAVIIMDSDLQDPPRVSLELLEKWEQGWDVVYAQRRTRKDSIFKRATASVFYKALRRVAEVDIPPNTGDFRLLDRSVVEEIKKFREHDRFVRGMVSFVGFDQTAVLFDRDERYEGVSGYPLKKMVKLASDGILGFSVYPIRLISQLGYGASALSLVGIIYVLFVKLFRPEIVVAGWTFIVMAVLLMGGLQLIMLGVLGQYIGRIYRQVQNRPLYAIRPGPHRPAPPGNEFRDVNQ